MALKSVSCNTEAAPSNYSTESGYLLKRGCQASRETRKRPPLAFEVVFRLSAIDPVYHLICSVGVRDTSSGLIGLNYFVVQGNAPFEIEAGARDKKELLRAMVVSSQAGTGPQGNRILYQ